MRDIPLLVIASLAVAARVNPQSFNIPPECPLIDPIGEILHLPHESDCTKFYKCSNGNKIIQDCPFYNKYYRLHFDPELDICNWPWVARCQTEQKECTPDQSVQPHPYNCSLYYKCQNGRRSIETCNEGQRFDSELMTCMPLQEARCKLYLDTCPLAEFYGTIFLPHDCKCANYYQCVNGEAIERYCPSGQEFDVHRRECVSAEEAMCNSDTNQSPILTSCPATGIVHIPHPEDCNLYYECVNGVRSEKKCQHGLSFDETKGMCTWPPSNNCSTMDFIRFSGEIEIPASDCTPEGSNEITLSPHPCSCSKYYACVKGETILKICPRGMDYDHIRQTCDHPERAFCKHRGIKSALASLTRVASQRECSRNGNERLPHESNCTLYYQCRRGEKNLESCYERHYFNDIIEACDLPENTKCVRGPPPSTPTEKPGECDSTINCGGIVRLPHEKECSLYYKCENGRKVEKSCPEDLYFDPVEQICDWPENVDCVPEELCVDGEKIHHECQCNLYYECKGGEKTLQKCPRGKLFDYRREICDVPENVICFPNNEDSNKCIGSCPSDFVKNLPHEDCKKYCRCNNGVSEIVDCPKNKYYDSTKEECDWPENVSNLRCNPFPCSSNSTGERLPHECYCDRYYVCLNGTKMREKCENGQYFDYEKQICVNQAEAHCFEKEFITRNRE